MVGCVFTSLYSAPFTTLIVGIKMYYSYIHILHDSLNKSCNVLLNQATQEKDHQVPNPSPYSLDQQPGKHKETTEQQLASLA